MTPTLLLASQSPRRRELLSRLGFPLRIVEVQADETLSTPLTADRVAEAIACRKAEAYTQPLAEDEILVTADTVVVHRNEVLGKPHTREQALAMLHSLSDDNHHVYTGVCLRSARSQTSFSECTLVHFRALSDDDIQYYVDTFRPYDKAGAYGIQEWIGMVGIDRIDGCYYNVMGLPTTRLYQELKKGF